MADNTILYGTWYFNETIDQYSVPSTYLNFKYILDEEVRYGTKIELYIGALEYYNQDDAQANVYNDTMKWYNEGYRTIVITSGGSDTFLTWLQANATKINDSIDINGIKTNKMLYADLMNELVDVINDRASGSGAKTLGGLVETAKTIVNPSGTITITSSGRYNVKEYETAEVNVSAGIVEH